MVASIMSVLAVGGTCGEAGDVAGVDFVVDAGGNAELEFAGEGLVVGSDCAGYAHVLGEELLGWGHAGVDADGGALGFLEEAAALDDDDLAPSVAEGRRVVVVEVADGERSHEPMREREGRPGRELRRKGREPRREQHPKPMQQPVFFITKRGRPVRKQGRHDAARRRRRVGFSLEAVGELDDAGEALPRGILPHLRRELRPEVSLHLRLRPTTQRSAAHALHPLRRRVRTARRPLPRLEQRLQPTSRPPQQHQQHTTTATHGHRAEGEIKVVGDTRRKPSLSREASG
mmetsp:Transcript_29708/g.95807  ORF Transcript_29708/g.95807 Transcript_29708/m.95807 type:complete len:288 (+) Transcript_29708:251-1114(+)